MLALFAASCLAAVRLRETCAQEVHSRGSVTSDYATYRGRSGRLVILAWVARRAARSVARVVGS